MAEPNYERRQRLFSVIIILVIVVVFIGIGTTLTKKPKALTAIQKVQPGLYRVTTFYDGDTIAVDMNGEEEKIRMIGVDTPETKDPRKPVECYGHMASDFTKNLIGSDRVRLEADSQSTNRDRYNRLLRYVYLPDGRMVEKELITGGYGFAYIGFPFDKKDEFVTYQKQAQDTGKGLWGSCQPYYDKKGYIHSNPET